MNLGQLRTEVRLRANVPSTDGVWTDDFVDSALNEALASISLEQPWWWLQSTKSTTATDGVVDLTTVAPTIRDIVGVFVDDYEAKKVSVLETDAAATYGPVDARYAFSVWGDTLQIRPAPADTAVIKVRYYRDEALLAADADEVLMPAVYHPSVVEKAVSICFESLDDTSSAAMHEARSRSLLSHMIATALRRLRGRHSVRVRSGYPY